ncbi:Methionine--tRNA ligase [Diplonema papillatum]|nr:Methionine--tRNA ligase [Diplonema papillatum]
MRSARALLAAGKKPFYITTAINYTNGPPHIGHAYEAVLADVCARYKRAQGEHVFFLTGSDEHGQKIANRAKEEGVEPAEYCERWVAAFRALNEKLRVTNDCYIRTTDPRHAEVCRALWRKCWENDDVYLSDYVGWYNEREESFVSPTDAKATDFKDAATGTPLKQVSERCYFFRLERHRAAVLAAIEQDSLRITPQKARDEVLGMLSKPLNDLCISRSACTWGVPLPEDISEPGHVMYVWFDALANYLSGPLLRQFDGAGGAPPLLLGGALPCWPADVHVIGKDIARFHCIYWPAVLASAGLPLPREIVTHGFVTDAAGSKMSKSIGNVSCPTAACQSFPPDSFRSFLCSEAVPGADVKFSAELLAAHHNSVLAPVLGNLAQRAAALCKKLTASRIPDTQGPAPLCEHSTPFSVSAVCAAYSAAMSSHELKAAQAVALDACRATNKWLTLAEPWKLQAAESLALRGALVRTLAEAVCVVAHLLEPFLPGVADAILHKFSAPRTPLPQLATKTFLDILAPGSPLQGGDLWATGEKTLFPKVEATSA